MPLNERGIRMNRRRSIRKTLGTNSYTRDTVPNVYADFFKREQTMVKDFADATKTPKKKKRSRKKHITITAKKDIFEDPMFQPIAKHEDKHKDKPEKQPETSEKKPEKKPEEPETSEDKLSAGSQKKIIKITCGLTPDKKKGELIL